MRRAGGVEPVEWLRRTTRPGDLLLTGDGGALSRAIQWGTRSNVSHTAIVRSGKAVVEAYDYGLTPPEDDEGVFETTFAEIFDRAPKLDHLIVRRPQGWEPANQARLERVIAFAIDHSPPFPTVGAGLTCVLVALTHPIVRRVTDRLPDPLARRFDRLLDWLVATVGDGPTRVHCSEMATRLYTRAGLELRFPAPTLGPLLFRLAAAKRTDDDRLKMDKERRGELTTLVVRARRAERSARPTVVKGSGSKVAVSTRWQATGRVLLESAVVTRRRLVIGSGRAPAASNEAEVRDSNEAEPSPPHDVADLILPSDFERADPFETVGVLVRRKGRWREEAHRLPRQW